MGNKKQYPKIDIYLDGIYKYSTVQCKTCKDAIQKLLLAYPHYMSYKIQARRRENV